MKIATITLLAICVAPVAATAGLIGVGPWTTTDTLSEGLYSIDIGTGLATRIGPTGVRRIQGLTLGPSGEVIGHTGPTLYSVNVNTGLATSIATIPEASAEGSLAYQSGSNHFYFSNPRNSFGAIEKNLAVFDLATGTVDKLGDFGFGTNQDVSGLAFDPLGTLHMLHADTFVNRPLSISRVDLSTGAATVVLNTGVGSTGTAGLVFDDLGSGYFSAGRDLYRFDLSAGSTTLVGSHDLPGRISGLVLVPDASVVPEPTSCVLWCCLWLALIPLRDRRIGKAQLARV